MSDLRTMMHQAAGPILDPPTMAVARADRIRGTRALRRRRTAKLGGGAGLVGVAAIGVFALVAATTGASTPPTSPGVASRSGESGSPKLGGTALVSYTGAQPVGYVLDKVPAKWTVRQTDPSLLILAPVGAPAPAKPSQGKVSTPLSLEGTITVSSQSDVGVPTGIPLDRVTIDGKPAVIAHMKGGGNTRTVFAKQPSGAYLEIRVWGGLGWSNDQIVEFAESVHVTKDVVEVRG
jgi:hypothetical protein